MKLAHYTPTMQALRDLRQAITATDAELEDILPRLETLEQNIHASHTDQAARKSWLFSPADHDHSKPIAHVMWDLETLSTRSNALVLSIGAVCLDPYFRTVSKHEWTVDYSGVDRLFMQDFDLDLSTITWWMGQSEAARKKFTSPDIQTTAHPSNICREIEAMCASNSDGWAGVCVWGNGAAFDLPILRHWMGAMHNPAPWKFFNEMCYRTMKALYTFVEKPTMKGVAHGALDDAVFQAEHLLSMFKASI